MMCADLTEEFSKALKELIKLIIQLKDGSSELSY